MSTIKVRKISLDRLGLKTSRLLYNELPVVRSLVHGWFDGEPAELLKTENASFLRRLVVRSLKELNSSHEENNSYGGTSSEETSAASDVTKWLGEISPVDLVRVEAMPTQCSACSETDIQTWVVKSVHGYFFGLCGNCYSWCC